MAVKWFEGCSDYEIPESGRIKRQIVELDKTKTKLEFQKLERIIPDVTLTTNNDFTFAIEIVVTSDIKTEKSKLIQEFKLPTVKVDLSTFYRENKDCCRTDYNFVKGSLDRLLTSISLKSWAIAPSDTLDLKKLEHTPKSSNAAGNSGCTVVLLTPGLIVAWNKWIK